jgi:putative ABC transport system permease protein
MKSYFRFLSRNKLYTLINIAGLVVSLMFIILMGDYTWRQYSIDSWHKNADRICLTGSGEDFFMWPQATQEIKAMCPEVEQTCCVMSQNGRIKYGQREVKDGDKENGIIMLTDSTFFNFFDFELTKGDKRTVLDAPDKCVITERLARRLFGEKDPIGESLQIVGKRSVFMNHEDPYDSTLVYTVSGIVKDFDRTVLPNETQIIANMERFPQVMGYTLRPRSFAYSGTGACKAFLMLRPGATLDAKKKMIEDHLAKNYMWAHMENQEFFATPLTDIMFAPQNNGAGMQKGDKTRLHILLAAVLAILFFAVSNYINLTVANTGFRAKEMATRRLFGSSQREISLKLIVESTLMVAFCFAIGLAWAFYFQDAASELFRGKISLNNDISVGSISLCLGFILLLGFVSGILPSWHISRYQAIDIVKGSFRFHSKMVLGRLFIIVQNVVTVTMLTAALVIWLQLNHLIHAPLGFNSENLFYVESPVGKSQTVRNLLEKMPFVERIGCYQGSTFTGYNFHGKGVKNSEGDYEMLMTTDLDKEAFDLLGLKIIRDNGATNNGYYLNEEALRLLNYTGNEKDFVWGDDQKDLIAGILQDFRIINVLEDVRPMAIRKLETVDKPNYLVKTNGDKHAMNAFRSMLQEQGVPEKDLQYYALSMEDCIAETFEEHQNTLDIITLFTLIAIVISVMGYMGLSIFFIRQRQKEIAIRKVMGSTSGEVLLLMLRTFSIPMLISFVIAVPISWYIMTDWLSNFSYRIALSPWIFAAAGFTCFIISLLTVIVQSWRAASENPINNIKTE